MTLPDFQVAISFLQRHDRALAERLDQALRATLSGPLFVYWRHQSLIAGKDETQAFGPIFANRKTVDVVIYRDEWGAAGATLAEAQAIKQRHFSGDRNFLYIIGPTDNLRLPDWMPPGYIYFDVSRYPLGEAVEGIADLVSRRSTSGAQKTGLLERMQARAESRREIDAREHYTRSSDARTITRERAKALLVAFVERAKEIARAGELPVPRTRFNRDVSAAITAHGRNAVALIWEDPTQDAPAGSFWFSELTGLIQLPRDDARPVNPGDELVGAELRPEFDDETLVGWRVVQNPNWLRARYAKSFLHDELLEFALQRVFER